MADTNFTPQQIEEFLQQFFDVVGARQYIGARYVPIFGRAGEDTVAWDDGAPYEPLTVVMHQGVSYVSRRYVPTGIPITDTAYWVETYRFNAQVEQYRQQVLSFQGQIDGLREDLMNGYVPFPNPDLFPKFGTLDQVLTTLADGTTKWADPVTVDADVAEPLIADWLTDHPEATTTVQDGAITDAKMNASSFYSRVLMPRAVPTGTTALSEIETSGVYTVRPEMTDLPSDYQASVGTLINYAGAYDGSYAFQVLYDLTYGSWYRIVKTTDHTVFRAWSRNPTPDTLRTLVTDNEERTYLMREVPRSTTVLTGCLDAGSYKVPYIQEKTDRPTDFTETTGSMFVIEGCFDGTFSMQYLFTTNSQMWVRCVKNNGAVLVDWARYPRPTQLMEAVNYVSAANGKTYLIREVPRTTTELTDCLSAGSYKVPYIQEKTDRPTDFTETTGSMFVIEGCFDGTFSMQYLFTTNSQMWVRCVKNNGAVLVNWKKIYPDQFADKVLEGKRWVACGDSFTHGDFTDYAGSDQYLTSGKYAGEFCVYPFIIGNRTGMEVTNYAENGMCLATPTDESVSLTFTNTSATHNYTNVPTNADYITLYFGINDANHAASIPLGTINDTTVNTFYGAYNVVLQYLIEHHPNAHIGVIVTNGAASDSYRQATIEVADKWGIPYIDMNGDERTPMMIRSTNPDIAAEAKAARLTAWRVSSTNTHPNPAAHRYESTFIESFLKGI